MGKPFEAGLRGRPTILSSTDTRYKVSVLFVNPNMI
jgi:hypothetical protein